MIHNDWDEILKDEFQKPYFLTLTQAVIAEYQKGECYPPIHMVFNALRNTSFADVKVVILGQDPYHNPQEAMGLCFSVPEGVAIPPSLQNIFTELHHDLGFAIPHSGDLTPWTKQGVLLLNTILSVRKNQPLSHKDLRWEIFTDHIISILNEKDAPMVFVLWGSQARSKKALLNNPKHLILENVHPSPLSVYRGFFGSKPFSKINQFLMQNGMKPIDFDLSR